MPGIQLPIGIDTVNAVPADFKYGPYINTAAAIAAIPQVLRFDGLTVKITGLGEYWWLTADLTNTGLIPKTGGGGLTNPVCFLTLQKVTTPGTPNTLGPAVGFIHLNNSFTIDVITAGITEFIRDATGGGIYNFAVEGFFTPGVSPQNTEWNSVYTDPTFNGHGNIQNVTTRIYSDFTTALNGTIGAVILTTPLVMHDLITNKYYLFTFTQWTSGGGGGGFAYTRTEVILGSPPVVVCNGRITFDDGSWIDTAPLPSRTTPIARYVYLVQDASDVTVMGGVAGNAYNTFQAAYTAANALQLSLGGTNVVAIMVGNITAAAGGNLVLTANYNQYVYIIGDSKTNSIVGNITSTVAGVGIPGRIVLDQITMGSFNFNNAPVIIQNGGVFYIASIYSGGGNITIHSNDNAYINIMNTSGIAGVASGSVLAVFNTSVTCTGVIANSVAANVGACQFNSNKYVSINSVQMSITGSTLGTETIGTFGMNGNLFAELPNGLYMNTNHLSPVATWGGVLINNLGRTALGGVNINYGAASGASDLIISQCYIQGCDGFEIGINWQINTLNPKGGSINSLSIIDSSFSYRVRIGYNPTTPRATNMNVNFDNVRMTSLIASRNLIFQHSLCTFAILQLVNSFGSLNSGFTIINASTSSTQMTLTNQFIVRNNITDILSITSRNAGATSAVTDLLMNGNQVNNLYVEVAQGDMNFSMDQCTSKSTRLVASGAATSIRRNIITNSDLNTTVGNITLQGAAPRPKLSLRNSYLNIYTTNALAGAIDLEAYASFVDTIADVGSVSVYIGNVYTTTIKRLVTDNVAGLTFNASFDQPV